MSNNKKNRARRRARKVARLVTAAAMIALVIILVVILAKTMQQSKEAEVESAKTIVATEGLTEGMFLSQKKDSIPESGKVSYTPEAEAIVQKWMEKAEGTVEYHMTIQEKETYGANDSLIKEIWSNPSFSMEQIKLDKSQTRTIEVFSTVDSSNNQWYIIYVHEQNFNHSSQFSIQPGVYFFKADGTSAIKTLKGEITGEEKEKLMSQLTQYTLTQYCNPEKMAGRMGKLESVSSVNGEYVATLFSNPNAQYEISGTADQIQKANAIYSIRGQEEPKKVSEIHQISVEIEYGMMFDPEQVQVSNQNPYDHTGVMDELKLWDGSSSQAISLTQEKEANETWKQTGFAGEYSARGVTRATTMVMIDKARNIEDHTIIIVDRKMVEGMLLTQVTVNYVERCGFATTELAAGTYLFNDKFIWTDRGILAIQEAPNLYKELISFGPNTWSNVKWQLGNCGSLYLYEIHLKGETEVALNEQGDSISGSQNYARVEIDKKYKVQDFQTHVSFEDGGRQSSIDLEMMMEYNLDEISISLPKELKN